MRIDMEFPYSTSLSEIRLDNRDVPQTISFVRRYSQELDREEEEILDEIRSLWGLIKAIRRGRLSNRRYTYIGQLNEYKA